MPPRPGLTSVVSSSLRYLHTSAPLPPPNTALPPSPSAASSNSSSSSSSSSSSANSSTASSSSSSSSPLGALLPPSASPSISDPSSAISLIASQSTPSSGRYLLARLHSRTYLLHPRDILTVPILKPAPAPGTILALTRILEVGSRDFAIRSPAAQGKSLPRESRVQHAIAGASFTAGAAEGGDTIPPWIAKCGLTVLEHTKSPLERIIKKKRRKGYKKTIEHKQGWTRLRVGDIELGEGVGPSITSAPRI